MGVPGLLPFLKRRYTSAFPTIGGKYDHIYSDSNALLYPLAATTVDPREIARLLLEVAQEYHVVYGGIVHLFIDGPAAMGKIRHQRLRRFQYPPLTFKQNPDGTYGTWTQAIFTPGTPQMKMINEYIEEHMKEYPGVGSFSSSDIPGEGEHKLVAAAKHLPSNTKIAFISPDADMILLGMGMLEHDITILRHYAEDDDKRYGATHEMYHVNCTLLRSLITSDMKTESIWNFIIPTFFVGNDFIPPIPQTSEIFKALPKIIRKRARVYDTRTKSIYWKGIFSLLQSLSDSPIDDKWVGKISDTIVFDTLYYTKYFPFSIDRYKMVQQWIITVEWIFQYYHNGLDIASRSWQYNNTVSPTIHTILDIGIDAVKNLDIAVEQVPPLSSHQALAAALPPWLHSLLPEDMREKTEKIPQYYPFSFKMDNSLSIPIIPTIPYSVIRNI